MINVLCNGKKYKIAEKMTAYDFIKNELKIKDKSVIACKAFNEVKTLNFEIDRDLELELLDTTTSDGNRIYVRGITFVLTKAFEELFPGKRFLVNYAIGHAIYCESPDMKIKAKDVEEIKERMTAIVEKNMPFEKKVLTLVEASHLYQKHGKEDKIGLLDNRMKTHVSMYYCGKTFNYFYGAMPISTGYVKYFNVVKYREGLLLEYPRRFTPQKIDKFKDSKKLYETFAEYENIHRILGIENLVGLNKQIREGNGGNIIRICEALHEKKIAKIADEIASDRRRKLILIAGPSSSGKTTFAQRLGIQLQVNGIRVVTLSMDNYFVNRVDTPKDENGNYNFECLEALDLKLFNEQLTELLEGKEVELPTYDFTDGKRKYLGNKAKLGADEVLVVEGIHGLNEKLTASIPREKKYKIYISALTTLNIDDCNRITTTDTRILRRIVRDYLFRGHNPQSTFKMWESVRKGEEKYIFPFQEEADAMFNSSMVYEISALKPYAEALLATVDYNSPEFSEAKRLYELLSYFMPIDVAQIPNTSILREFLGGGVFYR